MSPIDKAGYYKEILAYWRNQDILVTRRVSLLITANTILFFVFHSGQVHWLLLLAATISAIMLNERWRSMGQRTVSIYTRMFQELAILEGFQTQNSQIVEADLERPIECAVYWNVVRRRGEHPSSTRFLCVTVPRAMSVAWVLFFVIAIGTRENAWKCFAS